MNEISVSGLLFVKTENNIEFEILRLDKSADGYELIKEETADKKNLLTKISLQNSVCWPDFSESLFTVVITSKCLKETIEEIFPSRKVVFFYAEEFIDCQGNIKESLSEPEMNRVLKQVYASNPKKILIHLLNGIKNPVHEKMFYNVLKVAGYKVFTS